jgi:serine/threonine-protein kinase
VHQKTVVIKVLRERVDFNSWCQKKFRDECEALARINHPGVVGILDEGETGDGSPFLVLEFVEGVTLRSVIEKETLELARIVRLVHQIAQALDTAHDHGVCHRDLKPENIMLRDLGDGDEMAVIIDFGVATVKDPQCTGTQVSLVAGSYSYMAPEQLSGHPEIASDIYALGVITFELIAGRLPFGDCQFPALLLKQQAGLLPRLWKLRPGVPEQAQKVIARALVSQPTRRYARAALFAEDLAWALTGAPAAGGSRWTRRRVIGGCVAAATMAAGFYAAVYRRTSTSPGLAPSAAQRMFSYYIQVQVYRNGRPFQEPFRLPGEMIFPPSYRIRLVLVSSQPGYLYLINEAPIAKNGLPHYNLLFPSSAANNGSALVVAGKELQIPPGEEYFVFDEQQGEEKLWTVWAGRSLQELEAARKWVNPRDMGAIGDPGEVRVIRDFLDKYSASKPEVVRDEVNKRTVVRGQGEVLLNLVKFQHY